MLLILLPINNRLLIAKFGWSQKIHINFQLCRVWVPQPMCFKSQLYVGVIIALLTDWYYL